jgi:tetratricopeptide (TPR) repeat protein
MLAENKIRRMGALAMLAGLLLAVPAPVLADSAELHNTTGLAFYYQGKDAEAFSEFVTALQKDPSFAQPHYNLARLLERQKRYDEALKQYQDALQLDPSMASARDGVDRLEKTLAARGQTPPPPPQLPEGLAPEVQTDQMENVRALISRGEIIEARDKLDTLMRLNPSDPKVLLAQADLAERLADYGRAIIYLNQAKVLLPGTADVNYRLAQDLLKIGNYDQAQAEIERAIQLNPVQGDYFNTLGQITQARGKPSEAYNAFNEAARLNPGNVGARNEAEKLSRQLGLYYYNAGLFYFNQKSWVKAKELLKRALEKGNLNPEQRAIAQQYLVVADFSSARVADQIREIQAERQLVENGKTSKRIYGPETIQSRPNSYEAGTYVDFEGWVVYRKDNADSSELLCTKNFRELEVREQHIRPGEDSDGGFRSNSRMSEWFVVTTPKALPNDPRVAVSAYIRVQGKLGTTQFVRNPWTYTYSEVPRPTVLADRLEFARERRDQFGAGTLPTSFSRLQNSSAQRGINQVAGQPYSPINTQPGLSGPLKIDYLRFNDEQAKNLTGIGEF